MHLTLLLALVTTFCWFLIVVTAQGNTTCKTNSLDWYTNTVGETPCQTYQQLRQICNSVYTVGSLSTATPPDRCSDQVAACCCNSVSFALSMLCLNCQQGVGTGIGADTGYDAGKGAYQMYLQSCSPNANQSLPTDIQAAVCNEKLRIDDDLYTLFWTAGDWYYIYTKETIQKNQLANANNTYTHCASTLINITTTSSSPSTSYASTLSITPSATHSVGSTSSSSLSGGAIAGIAIGCLAVLVVVGALFWRSRRRRVTSEPGMREVAGQLQPFLPPGGENPPPQKGSALVASQPDDSNTLSSGRPLASTSSSSRNETSVQSSETLPERHEDGGSLMGRSPSGRLPPAYDQVRRYQE